MYGPPGYAYVYLIYGMYHCMNIVCEAMGTPNAVLIRALEPIMGQDFMSLNRYSKKYISLNKREKLNISNGPGKLCDAMGINMKINKKDLCGNKIYLAYVKDEEIKKESIQARPRININYAEEAIHYPWRFILKDSSYISKK